MEIPFTSKNKGRFFFKFEFSKLFFTPKKSDFSFSSKAPKQTFSKILTQTTFVCLLFLKQKQKKNMKKYFVKDFVSKLKNMLFWGSNQFFFQFSIGTNVVFVSIFEHTQKKVIKPPKCRFCRLITCFAHFQKYPPKQNLVIFCFKPY